MIPRAYVLFAILLALPGAAVLAAPSGTPAATPVIQIDATASTVRVDSPLASLGSPRWRGNMLRVRVRSDAFKPVTASVRISALKPGSYDLYAAGAFVGSFTAEALAAGVPVKFSGGLLKPATRKTLEAYESRLAGVADNMAADKSAWPLWGEYAAQSDWVAGILTEDRGERAASISVVEKDRPTPPGMSANYLASEDLAGRTVDLLADLERVRKLAAQKKLGAEKEAQHLGWLIPLAVKLDQSAAVAAGKVTVSIENCFDRPVKGAVKIAGASAQPPTCEFSLAPGKSKVCTFKASGVAVGRPVSAVITGTAGPYRFRQEIAPPAPAGSKDPAPSNTHQ